jgi:hypothetical protein
MANSGRLVSDKDEWLGVAGGMGLNLDIWRGFHCLLNYYCTKDCL